MGPFTVASSTEPDWQLAVNDCVAALGSESTGATLGFVYITDHFAPYFSLIENALRDATEVRNWVGCVGIGICATGQELFDVPGLVVMTACIPVEDFFVVRDLQATTDELSPAALDWCQARKPYFGVIHLDPRNPAAQELLESVVSQTGDSFMVGGLASSRRECPQLANGVAEGGASGVLFSPNVGVATRLSQGCSPISARHTITKAERNVIFELDGEPALKALSSAAGELLMRNPRELAGRIFVGLPIAGSDTGDYLVRNLTGLDVEGGVIAIGEAVEVGQSLLFCRRDADSAHNDLLRMTRELKGSLSAPAKGALYFSCLARGPNLFGPQSQELKIIASELGDVPLVGFFANGEISSHRLYAYTGVLTVFT